ncbi:MAG: hypothetical protein MZW92_81545 [Comamonadaceae bacterium]|nr:hypothetical protein [Comamonadaceae bacterium]
MTLRILSRIAATTAGGRSNAGRGARSCSTAWRSWTAAGRPGGRRRAPGIRPVGAGARCRATMRRSRTRRFYRRTGLRRHASAPAKPTWTGYWSCDDLPALVRIMVLQPGGAQARLEGGLARLTVPRSSACCTALNDNTPSAAAAATSPPTTIWATTSTGCSSTTTLTYSCGVFERAGQHAAGGLASPSSTASAASSGSRRERSPAGDRHRLGRLRPARRPTLRLPGHHHHHLRASSTNCAGSAVAAGRAGRPDHAAAAGLPRPAAGSSTSWSPSR